MTERTRLTRRQALAVSGSALATAVAGCTSSSDSDDGGGARRNDDWEQPLERDDWEAVDEIRLEGYTGGWRGVAPDLISGIRNPSLLCFAGNEYELTWENADGAGHNIAIRNDDNRVVDNYRTEMLRTRGETRTLAFEATEEMHEYVCEPHRMMMGHIVIAD